MFVCACHSQQGGAGGGVTCFKIKIWRMIGGRRAEHAGG